MSQSPPDRDQVSLENCDKEPVHIPGHIQDIAVLIGLDSNCERVMFCSDNAECAFNQSAPSILGTRISDFLPSDLIHDLNNALCVSSARTQREHVGEYLNGGRYFDVWTHYSGDRPVVEFEYKARNTTSQKAIKNVRSLLARVGRIAPLDAALGSAVRGLRDLSDFDRVMLYQFERNGDGEIKAEAKAAGTESLLGLRFPSWDIPKQAREIMKRLPLRLIADVNARNVPLLSARDVESPLDLTLAASRGQSPVHSEYLQNMGVSATMTLSILIRGELWGMFAFHHSSPKVLDPTMRGAAELFVQFFAMQLEQRFEREHAQVAMRSVAHQSAFLEAAETSKSLIGLVSQLADPICKDTNSDGLAIVTNEVVFRHGDTPASEAIRKIVEHFSAEDDFAATSCLVKDGFQVAPTAGALVLPVDPQGNEYLVFFRNETALSITWAGSPKKKIDTSDSGPRLVPRASFAAYEEKVKDQSRSWEFEDIARAKQVRDALAKANFYRRVSDQERQRKIYIDELNHRIRNILALVRSLARSTKESSRSLEGYANTLENRIAALANAHDLAANRISDGVEINQIFATELEPFVSNSSRLTLSGDRYLVLPDTAPVFALIAHELMTNCVKHGALSVPTGKITVDVKGDERGVTVTWVEQDGPTINEPGSYGFGMRLIDEAIPYELDGESHIEFLATGLKAVFWLPAKHIVRLTANSQTKTSRHREVNAKPGFPSSILLVEDSMMVAMDMEDMLRQIGAKQIEKSSTVRRAIQTLQHFSADFAILDISLRDETSFDVADALRQHRVPFCFASGYGSKFTIPEHLRDVPVLTKPVNAVLLQQTISTLYGRPV